MTRTAESYINKALKPPKSFFDWCYSHVPVINWRNKERKIINHREHKCEVIEKRLTKNSKLTFEDCFRSFGIKLVTKKRIEIQNYCFWSRYVDGIQEIEMELTNLEVLANDEHVEVGKWWGRYSFGLAPMVSFGGPYTGTIWYENDWKKKAMEISELKYLDFSNHHRPFSLSHLYKYRREIEFLQKIKAQKMADDLFSSSIYFDMRTFSEKWLRANKSLLKKSTMNFYEFELEQRLRKRGSKPVEGIHQYMKYGDVGIVPKGIGLTKFQNWVIKYKVDMTYYRDYLGMLKDLSINPAGNQNLIIPKDLKIAHDNAVELLNQLNRDIDTRKYEKRLKSILKLETVIGEFAFVVPKKLNELVTEGKKLHHCVGSSSYVDQHKTGKTTIVFVRRANNPSEPYFTLEFKGGRLIQLRGKHNQSAPQEVAKAVDRWVCWVNAKGWRKKAS